MMNKCFTREEKTVGQNAYISKVGIWKVPSFYYRVLCSLLLYNKPEKNVLVLYFEYIHNNITE